MSVRADRTVGMGQYGHASHVTGPEPVDGPGVPARLLALARRRAGLTQSGLARRSGVSRELVNRYERGRTAPRSDVLEELLGHCGATLATETRRGAGIDRGKIREMLGRWPVARLTPRQYHVLRVVAARGVRFLVVGDAAARLNGAPIEVSTLDLLARPEPRNLPRLAQALKRHWILSHLHLTLGWDEGAWRCAWILDMLNLAVYPNQIRVAAIDDVIAAAGDDHPHADLLHAVRQEQDRP